MKQKLIILGPKLKINTEEVSVLMKNLTMQQAEVNKVKAIVALDQKSAEVINLKYSFK